MCDKIILLNGIELKTVADFENHFNIDASTLLARQTKPYRSECLCTIDMDRFFKRDTRFSKTGGIWYENALQIDAGKDDKMVIGDRLVELTNKWTEMVEKYKRTMEDPATTEAECKKCNEAIKLLLPQIMDIKMLIKRICIKCL